MVDLLRIVRLAGFYVCLHDLKNMALRGIAKPEWYDSVKCLYTEGPQPTEKIDHHEELKNIGYVKQYNSDSDLCMLTEDGISAFNEFRGHQLEYAKLNVTQIVSLLVGVLGGIVSLFVANQALIRDQTLFIAAIFIMLISAAFIEYALWKI